MEIKLKSVVSFSGENGCNDKTKCKVGGGFVGTVLNLIIR